MAELIPFEYCPGTSLLHKLHPLIKLISMLIIAICIFYSGYIELFSSAAIFILTMFLCRLPHGTFLRVLSFLTVLSFFLYGSLLVDLPVSKEILCDRTIYLGKLMCFIFIGLLFMSTTSATNIRGAVYSLIPSLKTALLITFLFAFIPLIFSLYRQTALARKLRMTGHTANPVRKIVLSLRSFLAQILISSDSIADAYTLRCPSDKYSPPVKKVQWYDIFFLGCVSAYSAWILYSRLFIY